MTYLKKGFLERGQKNSPGRNLRVFLIAVDQHLYAVKGEQGCIVILQPGVNQHADSSQVTSSVDSKGKALPVGKLE
jgi:hypothetical protein